VSDPAPIDIDLDTLQADRIREATDAVLSGPRYDLSNPEIYMMDFGWLTALLSWLFSPIRRLLDSMSGLPDGLQYVIIALLLFVLFALIAHIAYTVVMAFRKDEFEISSFNQDKPLTVEDLVDTAQRHADAGDFVDASRALYRAALLSLEEKRDGRLRKGLTNTEYLRTFHTPWVIENLRVFVDLINWKWYRDNRFDRADYEACRRAYDAIQQRLQGEVS